jgi:hypothetical protein
MEISERNSSASMPDEAKVNLMSGEGQDCWRWISVNLEYLLYSGFDYDLQLTHH